MQIKGHLKGLLKQIEPKTLHLMIDIWSSRRNVSVLGVQIRFIKNWQLHTCVVGFKQFDGKHDADSIRNKVQELLENELNLSMFNVSKIT